MVIIGARFVWMYPAVYLPRWLSPSLARRDPAPTWQWPFVLAFIGIRGVVSLAAALAIPLFTAAGAPFPERDMILAITFFVIVFTLVGQGLMLPTVIRWLGFATHVAAERDAAMGDELAARTGAIRAALARIEELVQDREIPADLVDTLRVHHGARLRELEHARSEADWVRLGDELTLDLIETQRRHIHQALRDGKISDESRRRVERDLDLLEARTRHDFRAESGGA